MWSLERPRKMAAVFYLFFIIIIFIIFLWTLLITDLLLECKKGKKENE